MSIKKGALVASVVAATILAGGCASTKSGCDVPPSTTTVAGGTANGAFTTTSTTVTTTPTQQAVMMKDRSMCKGYNTCKGMHPAHSKCSTAASGCSTAASGCNVKAVSVKPHNSRYGDPYQKPHTMTTTTTYSTTAPQQSADYQQGTSPNDPVRAAQTLDNTSGATGSDKSGSSTDGSSY